MTPGTNPSPQPRPDGAEPPSAPHISSPRTAPPRPSTPHPLPSPPASAQPPSSARSSVPHPSNEPHPPSAQPDPAVVAFGGGHGLAASLAALRRITRRLTAVVTVGDDGGSSGRLRAELGALPMGDLRMALAALAGADPWSSTWADLFQHRFGGSGPLAGHAVGNLVLTALAERAGSPVAALDLAATLLGAHGRVLPLSCEGIDIVADVAGLDPDRPGELTEVRGQVAVATTPGRVAAVRLAPAEPVACAEALDAAAAADWIVLGPGSLYTSVLPHLLVPDMDAAITGAAARRVMVLNLAPQPGETAGYTPEAHLEALVRHRPELRLDVVIADPTAVPDPAPLARAAADLGARLHLAPVRVPGTPRHDPALLAAAFQAVFASMPAGAAANTPANTPGNAAGNTAGTPAPGLGGVPGNGSLWGGRGTGPGAGGSGRPGPTPVQFASGTAAEAGSGDSGDVAVSGGAAGRLPGALFTDGRGAVECSSTGGLGRRLPSGEVKE